MKRLAPPNGWPKVWGPKASRPRPRLPPAGGREHVRTRTRSFHPAVPFAEPSQPECNFPTPITIPAGEWFVIGDNRGESDDSRFWGPVPTSWIVGTIAS